MAEDRQNGFSFQLQRFADGGTDGGTEGQESGGKAPADASAGQEGGKSADESPKADEAAVQRRIDEALASAKVKWEKDYKRKAEAAKKEAERLSKLSGDERAKAELVDFARPLVTIPSLAIHMDRKVNEEGGTQRADGNAAARGAPRRHGQGRLVAGGTRGGARRSAGGNPFL